MIFAGRMQLHSDAAVADIRVSSEVFEQRQVDGVARGERQ